MKLHISDGRVFHTLLLLKAMEDYGCINASDILRLNIICGINIKESLLFAKQCNLIESPDNNSAVLSKDGETCLEQFRANQMCPSVWMIVLRNFIIYSRPSWASLIPRGRMEAYFIMDLDEKRCFKESGLMEFPTKEVVQWWDDIASIYREKLGEQNLGTGRTGEELSIQYETRRTSKRPSWDSIDNNLLGYDITSVVSDSNDQNIFIEVKSSEKSISCASFFVTRNEWNVALSHPQHYFFHLWALEKGQRLAIISPSDLMNHIPDNIGAGTWTSIEIPFSTFSEKFENVQIK